MSRLPRVAVLASGEGQTFEALLRATQTSELRAQIVLLISNRSNCGATERATRHGVRVVHLSTQTHPLDAERDAAMAAALRDADVDWIVLAGYLKKLGPRLLAEWSGRIVNTHPSLLPRFGGEGMYGRNVHEAVRASGVTLTGASVHYVTAEYDTGPVIAQAETQVDASDDVNAIEARVKQLEQTLLVRALNDRVATPLVRLERLICASGYSVQPAMPRHLHALAAIERAAETLVPPGRLGSATGSARPIELLQEAQAAGLLWVVLERNDVPVGFVLCIACDDALHVQEMDVLPAHGRRGLGAAMLRYVEEEARRLRMPALTLTTFADLPWNAPFYARMGFTLLRNEAASPRLRNILVEEAANGLHSRVAMMRVLD